jgi:hypothetical protein
MKSTCTLSSYDEIDILIANKNFEDAEHRLKLFNNKSSCWHFLYSKILIHKAWFDTAKCHLEKAIKMDPDNAIYSKALIELMARKDQYYNNYSNSRKKRNNLDCFCCDCCNVCTEFNCCELICLDACCECIGGDLISCI